MTMPDIADWQLPVAPTTNLLASTSRNSNAVFTLDITSTLLPQSTAIAVAIIFKAGNAATSVDWQVIDNTLGLGLVLDTAQLATQPGMQVQPFPGAYTQLNPGNDLVVQFEPNGFGNLVADVYVYGVTSFPLIIPQTRLWNRSVLLDSGAVVIPAGTTGNVLTQATPGFVNRVKLLCANHVTAAAAAARVQWVDQFSAVPHLETIDPAVANFVWNNVVDFDNVIGLSFVNGTSQPYRAMVAYEQVPQ